MDCLSSTGRNGEAGLEVISGRMSQQISEWKAAWSSWAPADLAWLVSLLRVTVHFGFFIFFLGEPSLPHSHPPILLSSNGHST